MATPNKRLKGDEAPKPITVYVAEDVSIRKYATGGLYGTGFVLSSSSNYSSITTVVVHERHIHLFKAGKSFVIVKYATLPDGTIKIAQSTVVMHTKRPEIKEDILRNFAHPQVVELGSINSLDHKSRVSVKGEVANVSSVITTNETVRKIVSIGDEHTKIDIKLWGEHSSLDIRVGSTIEVTCLHVDLYQGRRSLNSSSSTEVKNIDSEEEFQGIIEAVSFEPSNLSIYIDGDVFNVTEEQLNLLFQPGTFKEGKRVCGRRKKNVVTFLEEDLMADDMELLL